MSAAAPCPILPPAESGDARSRMTTLAAEPAAATLARKDVAASREARARFLLLWILPIAFGAALSFAPQVLNDADTFWHLAAGRWMIANGAIPATDPFSYTFAGRPWVAHEWLSEVGMAGSYAIAGWS